VKGTALTVLLALMMFLAACGSDKHNPDKNNSVTDTVAPATPSNVRVTAGNMQAIVTWQVNAESDLKQYTLYWGEVADSLGDSVVVEKAASSQT
jgi:hypothetical protein